MAHRYSFKIIFVLVSLLFANISITAQIPEQIKLINYGSEQGLSQTSAYSLAQDSCGFIWVGTYDGLNRLNAYEFKFFKNEKNNPHSLSHNEIRGIEVDKDNVIWLATNGGGLNKYDPENQTFKQLVVDSLDINIIAMDVLIDKENLIWLATYNKGIMIYDPEKEEFIDTKEKNIGYTGPSFSLLEDEAGNIWMGCGVNGLKRWNRVTHEIENYLYKRHSNFPTPIIQSKNGDIWTASITALVILKEDGTLKKEYPYSRHPNATVPFKRVKSLLNDSRGNTWIGTEDGLWAYEQNTGKFKQINYDFFKGSTIYSLLEDKQGNIWIGTREYGIFSFDADNLVFNHFLPGKNPKTLNNNSIFSILEDQNEGVWVGTFGGGANYYNPETGLFSYYKKDAPKGQQIGGNYIMDIKEAKDGKIWMGTYGDAITVFNPEDKSYSDYEFVWHDSVRRKYILALQQDEDGSWWMGSGNAGLARYDEKTDSFHSFAPIKDSTESVPNIITTLQKAEKHLWIGTRGYGVYKLNTETNKFIRYTHIQGDTTSLINNRINYINKDKSGQIWIASMGGLSLYNVEENNFRNYDITDGLSSKAVIGILEDEKGNLWLGLDNGIEKFNLQKNTFVTYNKSDGLVNNGIIEGAIHKGKSGRFYFGGSGGVDYFYPDSVKDNSTVSKVVIDKFFYFNKEVKTDARFQPESKSSVVKRKIDGVQINTLSQSIDQISHLTLDYTDYIFGFEFSLLNLKQPEENKYAYRLKGFEENWNHTDYSHRRATYSNIPYGDYVFEVKAANNSNNWSQTPAQIYITVLPPWWLTTWAKTLWVLLIVSGLLTFYLIRVNSLRKRQRQLEYEVKERTEELNNSLEIVSNQKEEIEAQAGKLQETNRKLTELNEFKQLMTGTIVHDLKNPLNAIINLAENSFVKESGKQMLNMVMNILDVYKYEESRMVVDKSEFSLFELTQSAISKVGLLAENKSINLKNEIEQHLSVNADQEIIERVLVNLMTNAIKYTPVNGKITINCREKNGEVKIQVTDTGYGIPADKIHRVFDKFAQIEDLKSGGVGSTGIGLTFCKMAVEAHKGKIGVDSEEENQPAGLPADKDGRAGGSTFWFTLPGAKTTEIEKEISKEKDIPDVSIKFSAEHKEIIRNILNEMETLDVYFVSKLKEPLTKLENLEIRQLDKWLQEINKSLEQCNNKRYQELLKELQKAL